MLIDSDSTAERDSVPSEHGQQAQRRTEHTTLSPHETLSSLQSRSIPLKYPLLDQQDFAVADCKSEATRDIFLSGPRDAQSLPEKADLSSCNLMGDEEEYTDDDFEPLTAISSFSFEHSPVFDSDRALLRTGIHDISSTWHEPLTFSYHDHEMPDPFINSMAEEEDEMNEGHIASLYWQIAYPSPAPSASSSSNGSTMTLTTKQPVFNPFSTEMLIMRFAYETCGILSIMDGQNENPWRTKLLPMSFGVPALHHAILCLSAFHASRGNRRFRITGLKHMQKSIRYLRKQLYTMRRDTALATTLVLAFSESWNEETSTGIQHLKGARALITQAIANHRVNADFEEMGRLKFLRNTWVYMDVIARITALDCDGLENLDALFAPVYGPDSQVEELDPLMGCAWELFPLLGRVASLVREIRRKTSISLRIVSNAAALKVELLRWKAPTDFRIPQDESIEVAHTLSTAEAYRWSALLFLYQAVPMIATESPAAIAERILFNLVSVPLSSRVTIIQIFPLLVAGCELASQDNRFLVNERWESMTQRMTIGNLDRCSDVVHEVWIRRDAMSSMIVDNDDQHTMRHQETDELPFPMRRGSALISTTPYPDVVRPDQLCRQPWEPVFDIDDSLTVRGYGHWLTVMEDWKWAGNTPFLNDSSIILMFSSAPWVTSDSTTCRLHQICAALQPSPDLGSATLVSFFFTS